LEVRLLKFAGEPALVVVLAVALSSRVGVRQVRQQTLTRLLRVGLTGSVPAGRFVVACRVPVLVKCVTIDNGIQFL
jgi:hypothetical protein